MSLTSNEIIMIATPGLVTVVAAVTVYISYAGIMRRRAAKRDDELDRGLPAGNVWVRLTADESAIVRKMLEKDLLEKTSNKRAVIVAEQ